MLGEQAEGRRCLALENRERRAGIGCFTAFERCLQFVVADENTATGPAEVAAAAGTIRPDALTWVVVGDLARISPELRALDLAPLQVLDADGRLQPR